MKETDYINNLKNTIANLEKEYNDLINKKKLEEERLVEREEKSKEYCSYYKKISQYCFNLNKYQTKINSLQKELHYANAILEGVNTLKDIKQLLTKNE